MNNEDPAAGQGFLLTPEEEEALVEAMAEIDRGDFMTLEELMALLAGGR